MWRTAPGGTSPVSSFAAITVLLRREEGCQSSWLTRWLPVSCIIFKICHPPEPALVQLAVCASASRGVDRLTPRQIMITTASKILRRSIALRSRGHPTCGSQECRLPGTFRLPSASPLDEVADISSLPFSTADTPRHMPALTQKSADVCERFAWDLLGLFQVRTP
jgi:hypothetical protein